jgi:hypothetical protein
MTANPTRFQASKTLAIWGASIDDNADKAVTDKKNCPIPFIHRTMMLTRSELILMSGEF